MKKEFKNEIVLFEGVELRATGTVETDRAGDIIEIKFESIIETGRLNDSITWSHLSTDKKFNHTIEKKIDHLLPRTS